MTTTTFAGLGLSETLLRALDKANYTTPTPIQTQAIPELINKHDLLGIAQTGTGKTAAFALPLLQNLDKHKLQAKPRCALSLILTPTRELGIQIADNIKIYSQNMRLNLSIVIGGVKTRPQIKSLQRGSDILVATPGRLLDLINQGHIDLRDTQHLILDEADRMLDMGFIHDVRKIVSKLPKQRQTILFSATMPPAIAKLANELLENPKRVEIASKSVAVDRIVQEVHHLDAGAKHQQLATLLAAPDMERVIVFTRTKRGADKVTRKLNGADINAEALHGNKSQNARQRTLARFRKGGTRVLVATDIASRGIDVDDITHVINFELPNVPEDYVHRIGRTARAGSNGTAISLCDISELKNLRSIEKLIKKQLTIIGDAPSAEEAQKVAKMKRNFRKPKNRRPRRRQERRQAA
ncbi:MAG: DEAD/DEAH box helicase [Hyphomicrobiales bacterium]